MPTTAQLRATVERYAAAVTSRDATAYAAMFTEDAVQIDPWGSEPNKGRRTIRAFIARSFEGVESMVFEPIEVRPAADRVAFTFHITVGFPGGADGMHIHGIEVFTVTDEGLISAVEAYWGDEDVTTG
jgi:uncharacterized protein (TIGR02246 family)